MGSVGHDIVRRVRWGNVALACVVAVALAAVVVWPLVRSDPPALPPDASRPLIVAEPPPVGDGGRPPGPGAPHRSDDETRTRPGDRDESAARRGGEQSGGGARRRGGEPSRGGARRRGGERSRGGGARPRDGKPPRPKRRRERPAATQRPVPTVVPRRVVPASPPSGEFGFER